MLGHLRSSSDLEALRMDYGAEEVEHGGPGRGDGDASITLGQQMTASGAGALFVALSMTPLDVVKTRLQAQDRFHSKKCFLYSNGIMDHVYLRINGDPAAAHTREEICNCKWYNRPKYFNGTLDAIVKISRVEGARSLWSGLSPTLALAIPVTVIYLSTYERLKTALTARFQEGGTATLASVSAASGTASRVVACTVVAPLELIRTKMQSQKMAYYQVWGAVSRTVSDSGVRGLWRGYTATVMRDVPFSAVYWPIYERLRPEEFSLRQTFAAGAASGTVASMLTLPFDNLKTRRQLELGEIIAGGNGGKVPLGNVAVAREIYQTAGLKGFFTGITPRIMKVAPACAIMIASYEYFKRFFAVRNVAATERREQAAVAGLVGGT